MGSYLRRCYHGVAKKDEKRVAAHWQLLTKISLKGSVCLPPGTTQESPGLLYHPKRFDEAAESQSARETITKTI